MPAIRPSSKRKPPPDGFSDIENDLLIFSNKMKDAQNKPAPAGPKHQAQWEIFQISHQRSRYVYDLYYEKEAISKQLYDWLLKNGYADAMLIAKWKKEGYEKVRFVCYKRKEEYVEVIDLLTFINSSVAFDVCKRKRQTSIVLAYVESRGSSSRKAKKTDNALAVDVEGAPPAIEWITRHRFIEGVAGYGVRALWTSWDRMRGGIHYDSMSVCWSCY
ncbi:hypothetical protein E4U32_001813 [Claviceps aff. humidiphila group G2b]|nr:hypothetical protein E4U32_001813 [Claviceps aff. humidiphila group G2b]